jgi:hypothetical protein
MTDFKWAHHQEANIKEPIASLKEQGWQYGDIPTASNFNWLFHEIGEGLKAQEESLTEHRDKIASQISQAESAIVDNKEALAELKKLLDDRLWMRHVILGTLSSLILALNSRKIYTGLKHIYPFDPLEGTPPPQLLPPPKQNPLCLRCRGYHASDFDCHSPLLLDDRA